jgi:hypothetical protein
MSTSKDYYRPHGHGYASCFLYRLIHFADFLGAKGLSRNLHTKHYVNFQTPYIGVLRDIPRSCAYSMHDTIQL